MGAVELPRKRRGACSGHQYACTADIAQPFHTLIRPETSPWRSRRCELAETRWDGAKCSPWVTVELARHAIFLLALIKL